ncbi:ParB/Srx family N-terminal domain-containing protein [Sphingobacterium bambusae]|uniref:ParB/Srx family N-terminal domain-containing protein n=1 Tax=Sphingobacterium bambusae TaxID=662858 RepID=A0ABW6BM86_9SPHI|nr:ParB/Srx family N-terminal domain-containing protein [Sphingobacterium bambusae]WPL47894.1 ParB/Srx family N-terminal domain-containing protein [Sphingobacterium bambusae]
MRDKQLPQIKLVDVDKLCFDSNNPRIMQEQPEHSERNLIRILNSAYPLAGLIRSIFCNGILATEPLIVVPQGEQWKVIDGNRRLAVLKILHDTATYEYYLPKEIYRYATHDLIAKQTRIPVIELQEDDEALWKARLSRHMHARTAWPLLNESAYIAYVEDKVPISTALLSKHVGMKDDALGFFMVPMRIILALEEAGRWTRWTTKSEKLHYPTLIKACCRPSLMKHIGWKSRKRLDKLNLDHALELMYWLFGNRWNNTPPLINNVDRDLDTLNTILRDEQSLDRLRETGNLQEAFAVAMETKFALRRKLQQIDDSVQSLIRESRGGRYPRNQAQQLADSIRSTADLLIRELERP